MRLLAPPEIIVACMRAGNVVRYSAKAVGDLDPTRTNVLGDGDLDIECSESVEHPAAGSSVSDDNENCETEFPKFEQAPYANGTSNEWIINKYDIEALAVGAGLLGCGGNNT